MANTYTLINSTSLSTTAASVTFSSIPATYDDLVLQWSARGDVAGNSNLNLRLRPNSSSATEYSATQIYGYGTSVASSNDTGLSYVTIDSGAPSAGDTANTFGNSELYLPGYTKSQNKPFGSDFRAEGNTASIILGARAMLWRNTSAITSLYIYTNSGNFVSGSTFWLYGIRNV